MSTFKKLDETQVTAFNTDDVTDVLWNMVNQHIIRYFPDGNFKFIDIGGGNGNFTDRILNQYVKSKGILIDNSELLINTNKKNPRKLIINDSIENIDKYIDFKVDIIFFNWLLHHLVSSSYSETINNIKGALLQSKSLVSSTGFISIFENMYDGLLVDNLPSHLIFHLTSSKLISPLIKRLGANTAGCGVGFLSQNKWCEVIKETGLDIISLSDDGLWYTPMHHKVFLHVKQRRVSHFWLRRTIKY